jgi:hypothetical protein
MVDFGRPARNRRGTDRADCMRKFKEAWARFAADEANLTLFLAQKRKARRGATR